MPRFATVLVIFLAAAALSGCFVGTRELIGPGDAVFPYEEITFAEVGSSETTTLVHKGNAYRSDDPSKTATFRLKSIAPDTYVAQAAGTDDTGKITYLYATLKVDAANGLVRSYNAVAKDGDAAPGLTPCNDDSLCFGSLQPYLDFSLKRIAAGVQPDAVYRLVATK